MFAFIKSVLLKISYLLPTICNILPLVHLSVVAKLFYSPSSFQGPGQILLLVWSLTEIIFLIYMTLLINTLNSTPPQRKCFTTAEQARVLIKQVLSQTKGGLLELMNIWRNLCGPEKQTEGKIGVRNAKNWISWAIYDVTDYNELSLDEKQVIDEEFLNSEEYKALNLPDISEIESPEWSFHDRNTLELSRVPFFVYFSSWLSKLIAASWFKLNEFSSHTKKDVGGLSYWFRPGDLEKTPIVFVHGVGIGLLQYISKIRQLKQLNGDRPLVILQLDYISLSLIHKIPTTAEHLTLIDHIFASHALKPANWISHSYGSFVGAFVTEKRPHFINNITFVDPICFGLIFCNSLYNLLFTPLKCWTLGFIRYFGAFELSFNYIIHREFIWQDRIFWPEYCNLIDGKVTVYLSEFDSIIDEKEVGNYVRQHFKYKNFELKTIKGEYHGGYLFNSVKLNEVLEEL